jgi:Thioesterase domain/Phosphopantetheine attachment site
MNTDHGPTAGTTYQHPRDPAEIWVTRQWQNILGFTVGTTENFFSIGGNSLDAARVIDAILAEFGIQLPLNTLTEHPTPAGLAALLRDRPGPLTGPLITLQDGDSTHPPLFLIHPDNGHAAPYCPLTRELGEDYTVIAVQAAGLHPGQDPRRTIPAMADAYTTAIRAACPHGPYQLAGTATGTAIAYEIATRLDGTTLLAAITTPLPGPPASTGPHDPAPGSAARTHRVQQANHDALRTWHPSPYTGTIDILGPPPATPLPPATPHRTHPCTTPQHLTDTLRQLLT